MTASTDSNPTAIAMIEGMIKDNELSIKLLEQTMQVQLAELERTTAMIKQQLEGGFNIDTGWLREKAHKAEESISKRRSLYETKASLAHVMKAAGGE